MKKIIISILSVFTIFALVAMKPMYINSPPMGQLQHPLPKFDPQACVGCDPIMYNVILNTKCLTKFDLWFTVKQGEIDYPKMSMGAYINSKSFRASDYIALWGLDPNSSFELTTSGLSLRREDGLLIGNVLPGFRGTVCATDSNGDKIPGPCNCFFIDWNESTHTITITEV
jgi:hypothetical protein